MVTDFNNTFKQALLSLLGAESFGEQKFVVAVSGGVDSMVCLRAMLECVEASKVVVAHCNYGLRDQADTETQMLEQTCKRWGVECQVARFDTASICAQRGEGVQVVARELRYGFFEELCHRHGANYIVLGHNTEDCSETFFINLLRGSGLRGLRGMPHKRAHRQDFVLRPMVFASRSQIVQYAKACGVPFMEDASNNETYYLRNKLRHNILPHLRGIDNNFDKTLASVCSKLGESYDFQMQIAQGVKGRVFEGQVLVTEKFLSEDASSSYLLYLLLQSKGFSRSICEDIYRDMLAGEAAQGNIYDGTTQKALLNRGCILFEDISQSQGEEEYYISEQQVKTFERHEIEDLRSGADFAYFDFDKLSFPLKVRPWKQGDKLAPYGMGGKEKLVSDILIDAKLSKFDKQRVKVVVSGETIIWIVGIRTSHLAAVDSSTLTLARVVPAALRTQAAFI